MPCTEHRAFLYDRGGENRISEIWPLQRCRWERVRDDVSTSNIFAPRPDPRCVEALKEIEPGRHEIVIYRDGKRVWEGPVTLTTEAGQSITIDSRDVGHYLGRTIMRSATGTAAALALFGRRTGVVICWACRHRTGRAGLVGLRRISVRTAGTAALTLSAPGGFTLPALCYRRPVCLRHFAAVGVTHVSFPPRRARPKGMLQALIRFSLGGEYQQDEFSPNSF